MVPRAALACALLVSGVSLGACRPKISTTGHRDAAAEPPSFFQESGTTGAGDEDVTVIVRGTQLLVGDEAVADVAAAADAAKKRAAALKTKTPTAIVIAAPSEPYRAVSDVVVALAKAGFSRFHFMLLAKVVKAGSDAGQDRLPSAEQIPSVPFRAGAKKLLLLTIRLAKDGAWMSTLDGAVGPGCNTGPVRAGGPTFPRKDRALDLTGVRRCAQQLKAEHADESAVTIEATGDTPYGELIATADAVRDDGHATMFPSFSFAPAK